MGANQSSDGSAPQDGRDGEIKTSYYELLGVERQATDDEYGVLTPWLPYFV
jgi:DnaJ homolog subfamily A member 5